MLQADVSCQSTPAKAFRQVHKVTLMILWQVPSKQWLKSQTADWKVKTFLKINVPRDEALDIISQEGMLLVLCSFIDNMPYVVAEAAVRSIWKGPELYLTPV